MAKKVIENENKDVLGTHDIPPEKIEQVSVPEPQKPDEKVPEPKTEKKPKAETPGQEIPEYADRILRAFSNYPELYIDFQGGTFTVDTPPIFRSDATLYTNPYHKP